MTDELLPYYNRELAYIRNTGAEFGKAYPKIAGRLRLSSHSTEDPHVSRLIEAFAYLNARIRHKLDDDFPEITDALLGILYPHYLAPVPSMSVIQFVLDPSQADMATGYTIPKGTSVETEPINGEPCRFRTCYPATLWPVELTSATLRRQPFSAPITAFTRQAAGCLQFSLRCLGKDRTFEQLAIPTLRFFLKAEAQYVYHLYEHIMNDTLGIAFARDAEDTAPVIAAPRRILPVGFDKDEGMLPYSARSFLGYRLLTEFFAFPEKYLFFDVSFADGLPAKIGGRLDLFFYLKRTLPELEQVVSPSTIRMGCAPMVNLFRQRAEPIQLSQAEPDYHIIPDARRPEATEIYSVNEVTAIAPDGNEAKYVPFYSFKHGSPKIDRTSFWHTSRRAAGRRDGKVDPGTEVYISLVDLGFKVSAPADWTLDVETTCLNRDLPEHLPFGGDQPQLRVTQGGPISRVICLTPPTKTVRPALKHGAMWRVVSHLALNHLSISDDEEGAETLREILKLYDFADNEETSALVSGITNVRSRRVVGPAGGRAGGSFCRGVEVAVEFDEERFTGSGMFLFASVIERFLGLYCNINSFTRMVAITKQRGELRRWPSRAGEQVLV